ncbi:dihydrofolate reductase family protein [Parafrigoribacterium mesophilum]|uniref:dihydrofolate reductase family protein n=1 Tax=Parafrigoribacterium mesophilum TaxID=433646 RepID=UPI0031FC41EF
MQQLTVDFIISLDGYGAAEGWPGWWGMESPEYLRWLDQSPEKDHPILMGARTYRLMSDFAASGEPGTEGLTAVPKVVFSSTLTEPLDWANTTLVSTDPVAAVRAMKEESDRPLRTLGSVSLCRALLRAGLVDIYRVVIFPVITGATGADRIFDDYPDVRLQLVNSRTFENGLQLLEYVPTVLESPPGDRARRDRG